LYFRTDSNVISTLNVKAKDVIISDKITWLPVLNNNNNNNNMKSKYTTTLKHHSLKHYGEVYVNIKPLTVWAPHGMEWYAL
jgi:hypothetical protein